MDQAEIHSFLRGFKDEDEEANGTEAMGCNDE